MIQGFLRSRFFLAIFIYLGLIFLKLVPSSYAINLEDFKRNPSAALNELRLVFHSLDANNCVSALRQTSLALQGLRIMEVSGNREEWVPPMLNFLKTSRFQMRKHLGELWLKGELNDEIIREVRVYYRVSLLAEDYLYEYQRMIGAISDDSVPVINSAEAGFEFKLEDFEGGDVIASRDVSEVGAAIGEIPIEGEDGPYSHLAVVVRGRDGILYVTESLLETGVQKITLQEYLKRGGARFAVFRSISSELARAASELGENYFEEKIKTDPQLLRYNFSGCLTQPGFFCSQWVAFVYREAWKSLGALDGRDDFVFPLNPVTFDSGEGSLAGQVGVTAARSFAPSDIIVQPDFVLVGEWANLAKGRGALANDLSAAMIFQWASKHGYRLRPSLVHQALGWAAFILRGVPGIKYVPWLGSKLVQTVPGGMDQETIENVLALRSVMLALIEVLDRDIERARRARYVISAAELMNRLEVYRRRNAASFRGAFRFLRPRPE